MHGRYSRLPLPMRAVAAVCLCGLLALAGCGKEGPSLGPLFPVKGKITTADGKPLSGGHVSFVPLAKGENAPAYSSDGHLEEDGSYTLYTNGKPGAPAGKYRVVLSRGADRKAWFGVPPQYFSQKKSPLETEVVENKPAGGYDFQLKSRTSR